MDDYDWGTSNDYEYAGGSGDNDWYSSGSNQSADEEDWMNQGSGYSSGFGSNMWDNSSGTESMGNYDPNWGMGSSSEPLQTPGWLNYGSDSGWGSGFGIPSSTSPTGGGFADAFKNLQQQPTGGLKEAMDFGVGQGNGGGFSANTSTPGMSMENTTGDPSVNPRVNPNSGFDFSGLLNSLFGNKNNGTSGNTGSSLERIINGVTNGGGGGQGGSNITDILKTLLPFFGANEERKSADNYRDDVTKQLGEERKYLDPFAGERQQYMDLLKGASGRIEDIYNNPNSSSMYTTARSEMERRMPRQMSKNRFGMGINRAMSQGASDLQSKALADARDTFKGYLQPSGANINPSNSSAVITALLQAIKQSETNPMYSALGKAFGTSDQNTPVVRGKI